MQPIQRNVETRHFNIEKITDGVYAAIMKEGGGAVSNSGIINLGDAVLVFDTFNTQQAAEELKRATEQMFHLPIKYVVNSHWHGDHIRGNQIFKDTSIISTMKTREQMEAIHPERIQSQKARLAELSAYILSIKEQIDKQTNDSEKQSLQNQFGFLCEIEKSLPDLELTLPNQTFEHCFKINGTERAAELIAIGGGHTVCDLILYLPTEKVLFAGDIVAVNNHPFLPDGNPQEWIHAIEKLRGLECDVILPGHGPVGDRKSLDTMKDYILDLIQIINSFHSEGKSLEEIRDVCLPDAYVNWNAKEIFYQNLQFLYRKEMG